MFDGNMSVCPILLVLMLGTAVVHSSLSAVLMLRTELSRAGVKEV